MKQKKHGFVIVVVFERLLYKNSFEIFNAILIKKSYFGNQAVDYNFKYDNQKTNTNSIKQFAILICNYFVFRDILLRKN